MANSKLLWPTQEEERQRQELMGEMMQARGVDVVAVSRVDGGVALLEATTKCRLCPDEQACRHWLAVKRSRRRNFVPMTRFSAPA
jgi:hypothetical protein